jgi:DNA (cytosine-5)-methyltransferase 1
MDKYTFGETFVGAGGAHLGFKNKGFKSLYALDIDESSLKTLIHNNPDLIDSVVEQGDILEVSGENILKRIGLKRGSLDVFFGGIVCKGFSLAGERSPNDERNFFYHKQLEIVSEILPKISVIENVKGILNAQVLSPSVSDEIKELVDKTWQELEDYKGQKAALRKSNSLSKEFLQKGEELKQQKNNVISMLKQKGFLISVMDDIFLLYEKIGYRASFKVLNSADYGSATKRERVIIVAVRKDIEIEFKFPVPSHGKSIKENQTSILPYQTVFDALKSIPLDINDNDNIPMMHSPKTIERFKYVPAGKNIVDVMDNLPDYLKISSFYSRGNTMRLDPFTPSPTLVPGHSNFPIHPYEDRSITVREAATITGFPVNFKFFGTHTKRCELVGNAVPVKLAEAIASSCLDLLDAYYSMNRA